jgi:hypothetical protein
MQRRTRARTYKGCPALSSSSSVVAKPTSSGVHHSRAHHRPPCHPSVGHRGPTCVGTLQPRELHCHLPYVAVKLLGPFTLYPLQQRATARRTSSKRLGTSANPCTTVRFLAPAAPPTSHEAPQPVESNPTIAVDSNLEPPPTTATYARGPSSSDPHQPRPNHQRDRRRFPDLT